jgi:toxin-antitoxin system PIN domain toxin
VTCLLDVNVLLALLDADHVFHDRAHSWFEAEAADGWASCPITENGAIRILAQPRYPKGPGTAAAAAELLRVAMSLPGHIFWPDDISLLSSAHVDAAAIGTAAQVTDTYLLALAIHRGGTLATFDRRLSPAAVAGGTRALRLIS